MYRTSPVPTAGRARTNLGRAVGRDPKKNIYLAASGRAAGARDGGAPRAPQRRPGRVCPRHALRGLFPCLSHVFLPPASTRFSSLLRTHDFFLSFEHKFFLSPSKTRLPFLLQTHDFPLSLEHTLFLSPLSTRFPSLVRTHDFPLSFTYTISLSPSPTRVFSVRNVGFAASAPAIRNSHNLFINVRESTPPQNLQLIVDYC